MGNIKEIDIKYWTYYFLDDMINTITYNNSYKNIGIYYIGYITMKDSDNIKINRVNPL